METVGFVFPLHAKPIFLAGIRDGIGKRIKVPSSNSFSTKESMTQATPKPILENSISKSMVVISICCSAAIPCNIIYLSMYCLVILFGLGEEGWTWKGGLPRLYCGWNR